MDTGRPRPESPGDENLQAGTNGIGKHRRQYRLFKSQRG